MIVLILGSDYADLAWVCGFKFLNKYPPAAAMSVSSIAACNIDEMHYNIWFYAVLSLLFHFSVS